MAQVSFSASKQACPRGNWGEARVELVSTAGLRVFGPVHHLGAGSLHLCALILIQDLCAYSGFPPPTLFPNPATTDNYAQSFATDGFVNSILNSLVYALGTAALNMLFSAMAGFALARLEFRGRELIFVLTLAVMMIPIPAVIIPKFVVMNQLGQFLRGINWGSSPPMWH